MLINNENPCVWSTSQKVSLFQVYFTQNLGNSPIFPSFFSVTDVGTLRREDSGNASLESPSSREASRKSPSFISGPSLTSGNGGSDYCALLPEADQEGKQFGHQRWSNNSRRSSDASIIEIEEMEFDSDHIGKEEEEQERHERNSHGTRSRSSSNFVTFSDQQTAAKSPSRKRAGRRPPPTLRSAIEIRASLSPVVRRINETPGMVSLPNF